MIFFPVTPFTNTVKSYLKAIKISFVCYYSSVPNIRPLYATFLPLRACSKKTSQIQITSKYTLRKKGFQKGSLLRNEVQPRTNLIRRTLVGRQRFFISQRVLPRTFNILRTIFGRKGYWIIIWKARRILHGTSYNISQHALFQGDFPNRLFYCNICVFACTVH